MVAMTGIDKKTTAASAVLVILMFVILYFGTAAMRMSNVHTYTIDDSQIVGIITRSSIPMAVSWPPNDVRDDAMYEVKKAKKAARRD